jgi:hypothetical protein
VSVSASKVGTECRGVPAFVTCFQRCSSGWSSGESLGHGKTVKRAVCSAQQRGLGAEVCYVAPSCISLLGGVVWSRTRVRQALSAAALSRPARPGDQTRPVQYASTPKTLSPVRLPDVCTIGWGPRRAQVDARVPHGGQAASSPQRRQAAGAVANGRSGGHVVVHQA